jgi:hypothetical protein
VPDCRDRRRIELSIVAYGTAARELEDLAKLIVGKTRSKARQLSNVGNGREGSDEGRYRDYPTPPFPPQRGPFYKASRRRQAAVCSARCTPVSAARRRSRKGPSDATNARKGRFCPKKRPSTQNPAETFQLSNGLGSNQPRPRARQASKMARRLIPGIPEASGSRSNRRTD